MASNKRKSSMSLGSLSTSPWWSDTQINIDKPKPVTRKKSVVREPLPRKLSDGGRAQETQEIVPPQEVHDISEFHEIVGINDDGHPFIDINRLVFNPKPQQASVGGYQPGKLKLSDYAPDFSFIIFNLITIGISVYFIIMSFSTLQWQSSVRMFSIPSCHPIVTIPKNETEVEAKNRRLEHFFYLPCTEFVHSKTFKNTRKYEFDVPVTFPIFRTWQVQPDTLALVLIVTELANLLNVVVGISACLKGYKPILIYNMVVNWIVVGMEFIISIWIAASGTCDKEDLSAARLLLTHYVRWYGVTTTIPSKQTEKEKAFNDQVDALQIGLGCCGMDGWTDYLPASYPNYFLPLENAHLDGEPAIIPFSCCRRWWIRNVFCAQGAHLWAGPAATDEEANRFHERIIQDGCLYKLEKFCDRIVLYNGFYALLIVMVHLAFTGVRVFSAFKLIKNIDRMVENHKRELIRRDLREPKDASKAEGGLKGIKGVLGELLAQLAPPTEDEIATIKDRSNFNKFTEAMKDGEVGQWMKKAQLKVTKGQDEQEPEAQTALEKKAREKELLHGKAKKDYQFDLDEIKAEKQVVKRKKSAEFMTSKLDYLQARSKAEGVAEESSSEEESAMTASVSQKPRRKRKKKKKKPVPIEEEPEEEPKKRRRRRRRKKKKPMPEKKPWWTWF